MRNSYHTQQRCALLAFLSAHADEQFTVEQLLAAMGDEAPGRSTVYRALDRLVEEGTVRRFAPESGGSAAYQEAMRRFLSKPPVALKAPGDRYMTREEAHDRARLRR